MSVDRFDKKAKISDKKKIIKYGKTLGNNSEGFVLFNEKLCYHLHAKESRATLC